MSGLKRLAGVALVVCGLAYAGQAQETVDLSDFRRGIHDPSIIKQGSTWYVFSSWGRRDGRQLPVHCSEDLETWRGCGYVFNQMPEWIRQRIPNVPELWAPDISLEDGQYRLYYAFSIFGKNTSGIGLATNKTLDPRSPEYGWVDKGMIVESTAENDYNTIDPNFLRDDKGQDWLVFGSFWTGIKMRRLDADGRVSSKDKKLYSLARRARLDGATRPGTQVAARQGVEAPFLVRHGDYFYLFTSWDLCCEGAASTYHVVVGRSKKVTGAYKDESGRKLTQGGGTTILAGNKRWSGPGGQSVWVGPDGKDLLVYHAYDHTTGRPHLLISPIRWVDDWPVVELPPPRNGAPVETPAQAPAQITSQTPATEPKL